MTETSMRNLPSNSQSYVRDSKLVLVYSFNILVFLELVYKDDFILIWTYRQVGQSKEELMNALVGNYSSILAYLRWLSFEESC